MTQKTTADTKKKTTTRKTVKPSIEEMMAQNTLHGAVGARNGAMGVATDGAPIEKKNQIAAGFKTATVAILGRPNAGKSTLLNALMESEFSATSNRPQTTRTNVRGILQRYKTVKGEKLWTGQHVLLDTPGVNLKRGLLDRAMYSSIEDALRDVDIAVWVADCRTFRADLDDIEMKRSSSDDRLALWLSEQLKKSQGRTRWILALSKVDMKSRAVLLPLMERIHALMPEFTEVVPLSALQGLKNPKSNVESLLNILDEKAPEGPPLYAEEAWTDLSERDLLRNLIRESLFRSMVKEVPYESECYIDQWQDPSPSEGRRRKEVDATIVVSRDSLKPIIIGKQGTKIKELGISVRKRFQDVTGEEIILRLFVKVVEKWTQMPARLQELGYKADA